MKYLGANFEHWKICEWAIPSIIAYADLHRDELAFYGKDFSQLLSKNEIAEYLFDKGVSADYNIPATLDQLKRMPESKLRLTYNAIQCTHNLVDISRVKGNDLEIEDTDKYTYLLTYSFPCITNDSLILTKRGYIQMKDVTTDDIVLTKSNTWQKVAKKFDNGIHQTCYLDAMGFENIHCTLNHKFYVREMYREWDNQKRTYVRKFKSPDFKETKDLTRKDYLGVPVIQEEKSFQTDDLDFWYMIGMYLGDGWLSKSCNDVIIACNEKKLELLKQKLNQEKWKYTYSWNRTCYRLRFASKEIYNFIKNNIGTGCEEKHIPYEILCLPKKQLMELYNGYLDSDGCKINNIRQFTSINRNLIYSISLIINKLFNIPTKIYKVKVKRKKQIEDRIVNQKDWYQLRFKTTIDKQDKAFYENGYIWYPFNKITMAEKEHVYNMEIENDHSYIIQGCISKNCQDLSLAGKGAGMEKGSGTRSGLLWEVERILAECGENLPQVLLMENVTQVHGAGNEESFRKFQLRLEKLGYESYWNDMTAVDFGIPQTRNRTFMVSILNGKNGEKYNFKFPKKIPLKLRLKDLKVPESQVAEKYYLSDKMVDYISAKNDKWTGNNGGAIINKDLDSTINTGEGTRRCDASNYVSDDLPDNYDLQDNNKIQEEINLYNLGIKKYNRRTGVVLNPNGSMTTLLARNCGDNSMVVVDKNEKGLGNKNLIKTLENTNIDDVEEVAYIDAYNKKTITDGTAKTILTGVDFRNQDFLLIKNATKQGYLLAEEGDGIDISSRMESHRGTVQKGKAQTITTMGGENVGVVVKRDTPNYTEKSLEKIKKNIIEDDVSGSLTATGMQSINHDGCQLIKVNLKRGYACEVKKEQEDTTDVDIIGNYSKSGYNQTSIVGKNGVAPTVTENHGQVTAIVVDKNAKE